MTDNASAQFRTVMRGYDPAEVDKYVVSLNEAVTSAQARAESLASRVEKLSQVAEKSAALNASMPAQPVEATYDHLGERIGKILTLADEEAAAIRASAEKHVADRLAEHDAATASQRAEAEQYAAETRSVADAG